VSLPEAGNTVTLDALLPQGRRAWSVVLRPESGWFALGSLAACFPHAHYAPLIWPREFSGFNTRFYVVALKSMLVGPRPGALRRVAKAHTPQYVVLDTGTTCTYSPPALGAAMRAAGWDANASMLSLECDAGLTLTYEAQELRDPDDASRSVFNCEPDTTLEDFDDIFGGTSVILLGAVMMRNRYWEYDLENGRVGMQSLA
jgi:hypothetical protein